MCFDSLASDAIFGVRQILKRKVTSAAAILSLGLAIGACTSAFRIIDALLLRPLPVAGYDRLYSVTFTSPSATDAALVTYDSCSYPLFLRMRADVKDQAESIATSIYTGPTDVTYGLDQDVERVNLQYVSGWSFQTFGLRSEAGRLLTASDDVTPGTHPYAVLSYDYWNRRFGRRTDVVGLTFKMGKDVYEIVGVAENGFTGTETGWATDVFVPMAMKNPQTLASLNNFWVRTLIQLKPDVGAEPVEEKLRTTFQTIQEERLMGLPAQTQRDRERFFQEKLSLQPASAGRSNLQIQYSQGLTIVAVLVGMVLLITCVNLANLMTAQATSRAREMALRVSIGASQWRLVQLVLLESAWLAALATVVGALFTWRAAPFVVDMINPPASAARLDLPLDWRVFGFAAALACGVTFLCTLAPALRVSSVKPAGILRGGGEPHWHGRLMRSLIAVQVAFCVVVYLAAALFVTTFQHLSHQPIGFSSEGVLNLETISNVPQSPLVWHQLLEHLKSVPGVEKAALTGWPLLSGESAVGNISVDGGLPNDVFSDFVMISPGWADLMQVPLLAGRDFRSTDVNPGVAIVNQAFAKQYFDGANPVGKWFDRVESAGRRSHIQIVGFIRDARSRDRMRLAIRPTVYIPFSSIDPGGALRAVARGTFVIRTAGTNPLAVAPVLRREVTQVRSDFRVRDSRTQLEINQTGLFRERLLAVLATFFGSLSVLLAAVGLYGVLDHSVLQRRREIGIRIAVGAHTNEIVRQVLVQPVRMVVAGTTVGLASGAVMMRYVQLLFFQVKPTDTGMLVLPLLAIVATTVSAAVPAVIRALRIDPMAMLKVE